MIFYIVFDYPGDIMSSLHKKWSFPLKISSVNATKSAGNCGFGLTFTEEIFIHFLRSACHAMLSHFFIRYGKLTIWIEIVTIPANIYSKQYKHQKKVWNMFKVNNKNIRQAAMTKWRRSVVFINFEHILHFFLVFLLTLNS